jgi:ribosome maturation protein Sdo1
MAKQWEIRGLFGNEYAMEQAAEVLKSIEGVEYAVMDRRNISVRLSRRNQKTEELVKRTFEINHGYVESEAPLGEFDSKQAAAKMKKHREIKEKGKRASH